MYGIIIYTYKLSTTFVTENKIKFSYTMKHQIISLTSGIIILIMSSCSANKYEAEAWDIAENTASNQKELTYFLEHYKRGKDKKKYEAACFLISNLPGKYSVEKHSIVKDIDIVKADSLTSSLEYSFSLWNKSQILKSYNFEQFLEYILPYRVGNEPLEYYWKWDCSNHIIPETFDELTKVADAINSSLKLEISPNSYGDLPQSYSSLIHNGYGKCDDRTTLLVMILRSVGIPAAYEFVPYWGSSNNGHSFASVILPDGKSYPLQNTDIATGDSYLFRKTPKVYRKMFKKQTPISIDTSIPELFRYNDILDVTEQHHINFRDVKIPIMNVESEGTYYLSVFSPNNWIPVAASTSYEFKNIGTGKNSKNSGETEGIGLGDGIVYLPSSWINGEITPTGNPLIVSNDSICEIKSDTQHREKVVLRRKFPLNNRIINFAKLMLGGIFEGANRADFSDAEEIFLIEDTPKSRMQQVKISTNKAYRYIRYYRPKGTFSIAELKLYKADGTRLDFRPIACEAIEEDGNMKYIFDSDPLTYYQVSGGIDLWVGADLHHPQQIGYIGFAPRNDDNAVSPLNIYELFYWLDGWNSLGEKKSDSDSLIYSNVPKGALLWLRNLTKGHEERPFTYQNNKQIWW